MFILSSARFPTHRLLRFASFMHQTMCMFKCGGICGQGWRFNFWQRNIAVCFECAFLTTSAVTLLETPHLKTCIFYYLISEETESPGWSVRTLLEWWHESLSHLPSMMHYDDIKAYRISSWHQGISHLMTSRHILSPHEIKACPISSWHQGISHLLITSRHIPSHCGIKAYPISLWHQGLSHLITSRAILSPHDIKAYPIS